MPNIYLGATISGAILLPPIRWIDGGAPAFPIDHTKKIDNAMMLDGGVHYNIREHHPRRWVLSWEMLTPNEMDDFFYLNDLHSELVFQNNWEDTQWRDVIITQFEYAPVVKLGHCWPDAGGSTLDISDGRWSVSMTLEEVI
jgi:hypothetical protein